ncbi:GumC family protein [Niabella ginsengisoli]|uniref:Tyrosine-protein kinase G-rich domain-containing protein n=1 Tax=Niabella ginsengisoli TaxID=522298 RepID=A0ABS9SK82_9BACT|nr:GNVR domain-containing protein [Niabella ginsengisoli]MCH5598720.1 hypothetical protein [Niabella ginsengisoli]
MVYNQDAIDDKNIVSQNTIAFIDDRLRTLVSELSGVEKRVSSFKEKNTITDVTSDINQYFTQTQGLYQKLEETKLQSSILGSLQAYISKTENQHSMVPTSLGIQDPTLNGLIQSFNDLQLKRQQSLATIEPSNILIQNIDKSLKNIRASISENIKNLRRGVAVTQNEVNNDYSQFQAKIKTIPAVERQLLEIQREQGIKQSIYQYLLQKKEESLISLAATVSNSRIIDETASEDAPVSPKKLIIYVLAFSAGLLLPFAVLYVSDILNDKVQLQKDILSRTNIPILGEIMHAKSEDELVVKENSRTPISEMFRLVRSNLKFAVAGKDDKVIMVTSSMSGEGKTFFCTNLGASLALSGKKR